MIESIVCNAGFYLQFLWNLRKELSGAGGFDVQEVARTLSCFHIRQASPLRFRAEPSDDIEHITAIYRGILVRGVPTLAPLSVERALLRPLIDREIVYEADNKIGSIDFRLVNKNFCQPNDWLDILARAHVAVDTRLSPEDMEKSVFDSGEERRFFTQILPQAIGVGLHQYCQPQTTFDVLLPREKAIEFFENRVDFSLETPTQKTVYELDGPEHLAPQQNRYDKIRDRMLSTEDYSVQRVLADDIDKPITIERLSQAIFNDGFTRAADRNIVAPLWHDSTGQIALHVVLASFGVARIQFALLHALETGDLTLEQERWKLTIVERDVSCAEIAVADFVSHLQQLIRLLDLHYELPQIDLLIHTTPEFMGFPVKAEIDQLPDGRIHVERKEFTREPEEEVASADLLIDISVLQRDGYNRLSSGMMNGARTALEIRSAYRFQSTRHISPIAPISYPINAHTKVCLEFFLQNIFRKSRFRPKQIDILERALALKPVIGLLPTGAGKSLCYQLSALLQPGMTIIVDPIVSLMVDQVDNLREVFAIDCLESISSLQDTAAKTAVTQSMTSGTLKYLFLTPERLQMRQFRGELHGFCQRFAIPYAVIDEAHCVSEWGHDFRTSYLRLADTVRANCKFGGVEPVIIALTGTASLAVLSDVQREIGIADEQAQIYPESFDRPELHFRVSQTASANKLGKLDDLLFTHLTAELKTPWPKLYPQPPQGAKKAGIIFTPHANGQFGARDLSAELSVKLGKAVNCFYGDMDAASKIKVQKTFKQDELALLVATKAFGMGIDKPNIRYTIHYNIPPSLESFYQEAGRAGRDGNDALCWLIFSDDASNKNDVDRLLWLHQNAFKGFVAERSEIAGVFVNHLWPVLCHVAFGSDVDVTIPFSVNGADKAIYRLAILGLVSDYTLDYNRDQFKVTAVRLQDAQIIEHLQSYIGRYKTGEFVRNIPQLVAGAKGNTTLGKCSSVLLQFVYDEIELKRRVAIQSMAEVARAAAQIKTVGGQDDYVRQELLAYLQESLFTKPLLKLAQQVDHNDWLQILELPNQSGVPLLSTVDGVRQLRGGCRRALESYLEHPGLLFLSSISRLLLPEPEIEQAKAEARRSFRSIAEMSIRHRTNIINDLLQLGYRKELQRTAARSNLFEAIATIALEEYPHRDLAHVLSADVPKISEKVIVNVLLSEVREINQRLRPERERYHDQQPG